LEKENIRLEYEREGKLALLELSEQTMQMISQEIHDNVGQSLTLAKLQVNTMDEQNYAKQRETANELLTRAIQDLRDMSRLLGGNFVLEHGLEKSIERELDMIQSSGKIKCNFHSKINGLVLKQDFEVILFRCAQEAMNNIMKYANANHIDVQLEVANDHLILKIADNGIGYDSNNIKNGLGLDNMKNRANILNGVCTINSELNNGTVVTFDVPLQL
jgi:two-component system, NarL family, sensor kinase